MKLCWPVLSSGPSAVVVGGKAVLRTHEGELAPCHILALRFCYVHFFDHTYLKTRIYILFSPIYHYLSHL